MTFCNMLEIRWFQGRFADVMSRGMFFFLIHSGRLINYLFNFAPVNNFAMAGYGVR